MSYLQEIQAFRPGCEQEEKNKEKLSSMNQVLFNYREKRTKPHRDEKILTSWNGLMIGSLAYAGKIFGKKTYIENAKKAADFIITNSIDKEGILLSTHINGESYNLGFLEDYAYFIYGLLELYDTTKDEAYLQISKKLTNDMLELFWDKETGGLFYYSNISEQQILRLKDIYDGATPSGNSIAALNLIRLYNITKEEYLYGKYQELLYAFGEDISKNPVSYVYSILALK